MIALGVVFGERDERAVEQRDSPSTNISGAAACICPLKNGKPITMKP